MIHHQPHPVVSDCIEYVYWATITYYSLCIALSFFKQDQTSDLPVCILTKCAGIETIDEFSMKLFRPMTKFEWSKNLHHEILVCICGYLNAVERMSAKNKKKKLKS